MNDLRTVIFVDGWNFHNNLIQFRFQPDPDHRPYRLDEKHFQWQKFFTQVIDSFKGKDRASNYRLLRVYLYNAATITPFQENPKAVKDITNKYREQFSQLDEDKVVQLAKEWYEKERRVFYTRKEKIYERIQRQTDFLEFKGVGTFVVKPFLAPLMDRRGRESPHIEQDSDGQLIYRGRRIGEKGVDIGMAVDMVSKMNHYDVAVVISGDADFVPVIRYLKDQLKQVYQFSIAKGVPPRIEYLSPWLKSMCDRFAFFDEVTLLTKFLKRKPIPSAVLAAIDKRVEELKKTGSR